MKKRLILGAVAITALLSFAAITNGCSDGDNGGGATATGPAATQSTQQASGTPTSGGGPGTSTLDYEVKEYSLTGPTTAPAGDLTFNVTNAGALAHEFVVIKTDLAPDALPVANDQVDVSQLEVVFEIESDELQPGTSAEKTQGVEAGSYVLICNLPSHYAAGIRAGLSVQ